MLDHRDVRQFYGSDTDRGENIFDIWERGDAEGDSVTPSTYCPPYRELMRKMLCDLLEETPGGLISIGCGNAAVEEALVRAGHQVLAVDLMPEAVRLARLKGIEAIQADVREWSPPPGNWSVVYADGLLGHLYQPPAGVLPILRHLRSWLAPARTLVVSMDRPGNGEAAQPAPSVHGFYWLSEELLWEQAEEAGFHDLSYVTFIYRRPISGPRTRVVVTARA
jgi:SAM-dependent methyltransferase